MYPERWAGWQEIYKVKYILYFKTQGVKKGGQVISRKEEFHYKHISRYVWLNAFFVSLCLPWSLFSQ